MLVQRIYSLNTLPDRVGDLIRLAVKDLTLCEANPDYNVQMNSWHSYEEGNGICYVCLAGSIMAQSLEIKSTMTVEPSFFREGLKLKLGFLNFCRHLTSYSPKGEHYQRHHTFKNYDKLIEGEDFYKPAAYEVDPGQFKADILHLADLMDKYDVEYINR